ncbi:MAG: CDP-alcohol phosphatidyltransferase family protein [Rhodothermaceae bacterium]|nr:CDP-alcohol phosphatidyltransferase family protein [Rhodothermaceae bacterium]
MKSVPNLLSWLRMILAPVFVVLYLQDEILWAALSVPVFAVAAITDYFDGFIARHYGVRSDFGVFLDPLADKVLTFSGFISLSIYYTEFFPWIGIMLIVGRDIIITMLRVYAKKRGKSMITSNSAKAKTFTQLTFLIIALLAGVFARTAISLGDWSSWLLESGLLTWFFFAVVLFTVYTAVEYIVTNRHLFNREKQTAT